MHAWQFRNWSKSQCSCHQSNPGSCPRPTCLPIEVYSNDIHVIGEIQDSQQVAQMTLDDWRKAQEADPALATIIERLKAGALDQDWCKQTNSPELNLYKREQNNLTLQKGILYRRARPRELTKASCSWFYLLPLERLLLRDATMRLAIWAWNAWWISCVTGSSGLTWLSKPRARWEVSPMSSF